MKAARFPAHCLTHIFQHLDRAPSHLYKYALVNKHWAAMALPQLWWDPFPVIAGSARRQRQFVETCLQCIESAPFLVAPLKITFAKRRPYFSYVKFVRNLEFCVLHTYVLRWLRRERSAQAPIGAKFGRFFAQLAGDGGVEPYAIASIITQRVADRCVSLQCLSVQADPDAASYELPVALPTSLDYLGHVTRLVWLVNNATTVLVRLATKCTDLRSITVAGFAEDDDHAVAVLVAAQRNLKELKVGLHSNYWRHTLDALATQASSLEAVHFASARFHPAHPLEGLAKCTQLHSLTFTGCVGLSDRALAPLASIRFPRLQRLEFDLEDTPEETAEVLIRGSFASLERLAFQHSGPLLLAAEQCPRLRYLITTVSETESAELTYLLTRLSPQLEGLGLKGTYEDESRDVDWLLRILKKLDFPNLAYLGLGPDVAFSSLAMDEFLASSRPPLQTIDLVTSFPLTDKYLTTLLLHVGQTLNALEIISSEEPRTSPEVVEWASKRVESFRLVTQS